MKRAATASGIRRSSSRSRSRLRPGTRPTPATFGARVATAGSFLDLASDLSSRFAEVAPEKSDVEVRAALRRVLELFELDRCALWGLNARTGSFDVLHSVGRGRARGVRHANLRERFPWAFSRVVGHKKTLRFKSLDELPTDAQTDKESSRQWGVRSALLIPLLTTGTVDYVVMFASAHGHQAWPALRLKRLHLLGEIFVGAVRRTAHEQARAEAGRFEELMFDLSSGFAGVAWDRIDDQINLALNQLLAFTAADQCAFFTVFPEKGEGRMSYLASHDITVPVGTTTQWAKVTPWLYEKIVNRMEATFFSRRDDLPPEAWADKNHLASRRAQAALFVPYAVDGVTRYLLAVVSNSSERDWPAHVVERLKVLGMVFISALNRKAVVGAQMRAQERLSAVRRFGQATLDALNEYVGVIDVTGTLVEVSDQWRDLAAGNGGYPESVSIGGNYLEACASTAGPYREAATKLAQGIRSVLDGDADSFAMESARSVPGGLRWVHSRVRRFVVDGGVYAAISHEDITARRKSEHELQDLRSQQWHAERITRTGVLTASLAHELSQPLTAILSNAQAGMRFIASNALDVQQMQEILSDIIADDKRAAQVIESLRIMLRRHKTGREPTDVAEIVRDVVRLLHSEFIRAQVEVEHVCAPECVVRANRAQIQQVVLNLAMNAVEAMLTVPVGQRRLRLTAASTNEGRVRIGVRDSGVGIEQEDIEKVFDAFWTTKSQGTGMGLAICHSIIEAHGGRIWGERNDDAGFTFFVELPAAEPPEPIASRSESFARVGDPATSPT